MNGTRARKPVPMVSRETWKQLLAVFIAMGAISHLTSTLVELRYDAQVSATQCEPK